MAALPSVLLGEPVVRIEPCRWGFTNVTAIVTLASGRQVVVQQITKIERATTIARLTATLPALLIAAGLDCPRLLDFDLQAAPPLLIREYIPGEAANSLLSDTLTAIDLARQMGRMLPRLANIPLPAWLDQTWTNPQQLAFAATRWLEQQQAILSADDHASVAADIAHLATTWIAGKQFAHGDFCPVNAIVAQGQVLGLVDLELARAAGPYFDAAWWGWVVRYHHPERWQAAWPTFLESAGLPHSAATDRHVLVLQRLRCLELLEDARIHQPQAIAEWKVRLAKTLRWAC